MALLPWDFGAFVGPGFNDVGHYGPYCVHVFLSVNFHHFRVVLIDKWGSLFVVFSQSRSDCVFIVVSPLGEGIARHVIDVFDLGRVEFDVLRPP